MHFSAAGIHGVLSVYRTVLLFCVIHVLVNSCVRSYPTETGGNRDSVRLEKLRWIAKQLTHLRQDPLVEDETLAAEALAFIRSLTASIGAADNSVDTAAETGDTSDITTPDKRQTRLEVLKRVYRQTTNPLGQFKEACNSLYTVMVPFLQALQPRFMATANKVLNNIVRIPEVLPPNDLAFSREDVSTLVMKFTILEQCLRAVLANSSEYVQADYKAWFTDQSKKVDYALDTTLFTILGLPFHEDYKDVWFVSCGAGCVNTGMQAPISKELMSALYQLVTFLVYKQVRSLPS